MDRSPLEGEIIVPIFPRAIVNKRREFGSGGNVLETRDVGAMMEMGRT